MLIILDGFGLRQEKEGNAIAQANTPNLDRMMNDCPLSKIETSGKFVGLPDGGLLFTTKDGELHARTVTPKFGMPGDTTIETNWAGEFAFTPRSDGRAHLAWSKRFNDDFGYTMTDISMASIGRLDVLVMCT